MSPEAVSPLRRRMIEDMTIRQFGEKTKRDDIRQVRQFTAFLGRSPDRAAPEDLRRDQLRLASLGASYARMNLASTALRFFFHVTLGRPGFGDRMARIPSPERLPVVLSPEEVARRLAHAPSLKDRAALSVASGCGLRVSEIANLKVAAIDSARMLIRVEPGKGRKDRYVMLSPDLLDLLRPWGRVKRSRGWLFPGLQLAHPITTRQLNRACHAAAEDAKLDKRLHAHAPTQLRDASLGAQDRYPGHPGAARAPEARYDGRLYSRRPEGDPRGDEPARAAGGPATPIDPPHPSWRGLTWKSRISSLLMATRMSRAIAGP
jgi:integrase/recombinase XerD